MSNDFGIDEDTGQILAPGAPRKASPQEDEAAWRSYYDEYVGRIPPKPVSLPGRGPIELVGGGGESWWLRESNKIDGNLWQGMVPGARLDATFTSVLDVYGQQPYRVERGVARRVEPLEDTFDFLPPAPLLEELAAWVNKRARKGRVLVHCAAGLNRSGLVVGLALIRQGWQPKEAIELMRHRRGKGVLCNWMFENWLLRQTPGRAA